MNFFSIDFIVFVLITLLVYYSRIGNKHQKEVLVIASILFYFLNSPVDACILMLSIVFNALIREALIKYIDQIALQRTVLVCGVITNVTFLLFFKYGGLYVPGIVLPLGVSFYTFQGISLLVDTYKGYFEVSEKRILNSALYLSFFSNSVSGPLISIEQFNKTAWNENHTSKVITDVCFRDAAKWLVIGSFLKVVVANNLQNQTFWMSYPYFLNYGPIQLWIMMFGYSFQLFADFAGYSLIAMGIAELFGISLPNNFNFPYISQSFGEFWRRWHISLSAWLRKYIYISLGGNRKGKLRKYLNLLIVMVIGGIWHGSNWKYILWGLIYGVLLAIERVCQDNIHVDHGDKSWGRVVSNIKKIFVFTIVSWLWLFFKLDSMRDVIEYTKALFTTWDRWKVMSADVCIFILLYGAVVAFYHMIYEKKIYQTKYWNEVKIVAYCVMVLLLVTNRGTSDAFIYFQF